LHDDGIAAQVDAMFQSQEFYNNSNNNNDRPKGDRPLTKRLHQQGSDLRLSVCSDVYIPPGLPISQTKIADASKKKAQQEKDTHRTLPSIDALFPNAGPSYALPPAPPTPSLSNRKSPYQRRWTGVEISVASPKANEAR
jgi:hypothetical protein